MKYLKRFEDAYSNIRYKVGDIIVLKGTSFNDGIPRTETLIFADNGRFLSYKCTNLSGPFGEWMIDYDLTEIAQKANKYNI
jgi:hypothetical protein